MKVSIMGAAGYIGGELLRLLLAHPKVVINQATSNRFAGKPVHMAHPNLRGQTHLTFSPHDALEPCDILFLALPHGASLSRQQQWGSIAERIIDLSADFRLTNPQVYKQYYQQTHPYPDWLVRFAPGIPELYRDRLSHSRYVTVPGCMATATILALYPLAKSDLVDGEIIVNALTGSSGSGTHSGSANIHAERSGVMRVYRPLGHRHEAEVAQACGTAVQISATGVEAVRGVQILAHIRLTTALSNKDFWRLYRQFYDAEPFIRIVKQKTGLYRLPEPKILLGSNYCDIGFEIDERHQKVVVVAALDNLMKGGAGNAVQCLNIVCGWHECEGLTFAGLHPI